MDRKQTRSWVMYDWANSAFATTILVAVLPIFYQDVAGKHLSDAIATSYWGYTQSIAVIFIAILAPFLGAIADYSRSKKKFLGFFAGLGIIGSMALFFVGEGGYLLASVIFIIASIGYSGGNVFYNGFLPELAPKKKIDSLSARGFAVGYMGGGTLLLINLIMIMKPRWFGLSDTLMATKITFVMVGIWWLVFSIPFFKNVKEQKHKTPVIRTESYARIGISRVTTTLKDLSGYRELLKYLIAFWLFNDGIATIMKMATIYGSQIGIGQTDLIAALVITQFVGIPCTFFFGRITRKINAKTILLFTLWVFVLVVLLGYYMTSAIHFYILAVMVGLVQGGAHSLSRSIFGKLIPRNKNAEFYGFYGISTKFSAILGPFVFALFSQLTGSIRLGILSVLLFFLAGIFLLLRVNVEKGEREAEGEKTA